MAQLSEQFVEDLTSLYFGETGVAVECSAVIDDAGERGDASQVMLKGRIACRTTSPESRSAARYHRRRRTDPLAPTAPDTDPE